MRKVMFSKGKWKYLVDRDKIQVVIPTSFPRKLTLGVMSSDDCNNPDCCLKEEHANAKLIAASPTLFYTIVILANETGVVYLFNRIKDATGIMFRYGSKDFEELVKQAKDYFNEKA